MWRAGDPLRPTLHWERFPGVSDLERDPRLSTVPTVTYELRLWEAWRHDDLRSSTLEFVNADVLVYARARLRDAHHAIDTPIKPGRIYAWAVRAHFDLDGHPRVTAWSAWARGELESRLRAPTIPQTVALLYKVMTPLPPDSGSGLPSPGDRPNP